MMNRLIREAPTKGNQWVSIHDMHISQILCRDNSVVFCFNEGFNLIEDGRLLRKSCGSIELVGCNPAELSCNIIKRIPSKKGEKLCGKPISPEELNKLLANKRKYIEVILELYDINCLYWRGEILPYNRIQKKRLMPYVTIEVMDFFPMIYSWE